MKKALKIISIVSAAICVISSIVLCIVYLEDISKSTKSFKFRMMNRFADKKTSSDLVIDEF